MPGIENLNTYDPEGRFYAKCALSNGEKKLGSYPRERGPVTKNYFPGVSQLAEINSSRREIINNKDPRTNFRLLVSLPRP